MTITDSRKIEEILSRGVEEVRLLESMKKKLESGKTLSIKFGIDPTGPTIHIGRAIPLWKIRAFQDLGHIAHIIIGDFTAQIGDPSDKLQKRPKLSATEVHKNMKGYKKTILTILDPKRTKFHKNTKWLSKLNFLETAELARSFSLQQILRRRNFKERLESDEDIGLHELLYPILQGYDSVRIKADIEIGGGDQLFNLLAGRKIQRYYGQEEQDIMTTVMLEGTDGRKMSTSWGNVINITDNPEDMFGKTMSISDDLIIKYFTLCTHLPLSEIEEIKKDIQKNPRDNKIKLAYEITALYHGALKAQKAKETFFLISKGQAPEETTNILISKNTLLIDILMKEKLVNSKSEARRLVDSNSITGLTTGIIFKDISTPITENDTIRVGKRRFLKVEIK